MSVVRDLILQADDDLRYPTSGELRTMVEYLDQGAMRVSVVKVLTDNEKKIIDEAAKQLFGRKPEYVAPGGNAYGQRQRAQTGLPQVSRNNDDALHGGALHSVECHRERQIHRVG